MKRHCSPHGTLCLNLQSPAWNTQLFAYYNSFNYFVTVHFYSIVFVLEGYFIIWAVWYSLIKKQNKTKNNPSPWRGKKIKLLQFNESICTSKRNFYVTSVIRLASLLDKVLRDSSKPLPGQQGPNQQEAPGSGALSSKKGQATAPRWREGRDSGRGWWQSAVEASAPSHLWFTLRKASAFAILKSRGERKTRRKLKGLEEERVSWSPGEEAERLMRRPEPSSAPNFHFVAAGEELNNNHLKKKKKD